MPIPDEISASYLRGTRDILAAARRLRDSLDAAPAVREGAVEALEQAATQQEAGTSAFREYYREPVTAEAVPSEQAVQGALALALSEIEAGNVLIASGQATGEVLMAQHRPQGPISAPPFPTPPPSGRGGDKESKTGTPEPKGDTQDTTTEVTPERALDIAIGRLDAASQVFEPVAIGAFYGFAERADAEAAGPVDAATFGNDAKSTLEAITSETATTVGLVLTKFQDIGFEKMSAALGKLGERLPDLGRIGRLIRLGIEKVRSAVDFLINLIGADRLGQFREKLVDFWEKLKSGAAAKGLLETFYGLPEIRGEIEQILARPNLQAGRLGPANAELQGLQAAYRGDMEIARTMATAVTSFGLLLSWIPAVGGNAVLAAVSIDSVIFGVVVLMGKGCTGDGLPLGDLQGVRKIVQGLAI